MDPALDAPAIVIDQVIAGDRLVAGGKMVIVGRGFGLPDTHVLVNGQLVIGSLIEAGRGGREKITVDLVPEAIPDLAAGRMSVQVCRLAPARPGKPGAIRAISGATGVSVFPRFTQPPGIIAPDSSAGGQGRQIVVEVAPPVRPGQTPAVLLSAIDGRPTSGRLDIPVSAAPEARFSVATGGVPAGAYLVRLTVDDFATQLVVEGGRYVGPRVEISSPVS